MKFTAQEEYGLRCLMQIARKGGSGSVAISEISQAEGMSSYNVAKLLRILREGEFVKSVRGQSGGYELARPAEKIIIGNVLAYLGGRLFDGGFCNRFTGIEEICRHTNSCSVRALLRNLQGVIDEVLNNLTLKDMLGSENSFESPQDSAVNSAKGL